MKPPDVIFDDYRFAAIYDLFNNWAPSDAFYLDWARRIGGPILDLGCGTGLLACRIAGEGYEVVGVDPASGMLRVAGTRPGSENVTWVKSDGQSVRLETRFNLIYMTGHAFQALLTDDDAVAVLQNAARHLTVGGRFVFETRNPADQAWRSWTPANSKQVAETAEHGRIEQSHDAAHDPRTGIVDMAQINRFLDQGGERVGRSRIRFIDRDNLADLIARAGLAPIAWYGDWSRGPFQPTSKEIIAVTGRAD